MLEHLEIPGCKNVAEFQIQKIFSQEYLNLKFVDLNYIEAMTPALYEQLKESRPDMLMRDYKKQMWDENDHGVRVPWKQAEGAKKKGKKKKKK